MSLPPGTRLYRLLRRWLPTTVSDDVLEPAVADLQYEAEHAHTTDERRQVILLGHLAIVRALVLSIEPAGAIRTAVALSARCDKPMARTSPTRFLPRRVAGSLVAYRGRLQGVIRPFTAHVGSSNSRQLAFDGVNQAFVSDPAGVRPAAQQARNV